MSKLYPKFCIKLCYNTDGWIVGSAATNPSARDIDIVVPYHNWMKAGIYIPEDAKPNCFGGWKFTINKTEYDVWPGTLNEILIRPICKQALHLPSSRLVTCETI